MSQLYVYKCAAISGTHSVTPATENQWKIRRHLPPHPNTHTRDMCFTMNENTCAIRQEWDGNQYLMSGNQACSGNVTNVISFNT